MGTLVAAFGALILCVAFGSDVTPLDKPLQYIAIGVGVVLILAGMFAHYRYRWGRGGGL